jgi:A/G-specific adenine glycosylase
VTARRSSVALRSALLRWYVRNRRPLPWRRSRDSYRVWVAEVMLQQTRVEVVAPAYRRFLRAFPSLRSLAAATVDDVLAHWSGLGYYTRARALHRAATALVAREIEGFPSDYDEARALPGVGSYTAAAVLSIAYGLPYAAVDGNVVRVLSRLAGLSRPDAKGRPHSSLAARLLDRRHPGEWNQAFMELGQTVCLPKRPRCGACPIRHHCRAFIEKRVHLHPPPKPRRKVERIEISVTLMRDRTGRILLERGSFPFLPHMWLPPITIGVADDSENLVGEFRHAILHRDFRVKVFAGALSARRLARLPRSGNVERRLFLPADLASTGRSSLLTKALALQTASIPDAPSQPAPRCRSRHDSTN